MTDKKMTKKDMFALIKERVADNEDMVAFIDHEIELLNKKANGSRKPTAKQIENEALKNDVLAVLSAEGKTVSQIIASDEKFAGMSNQKMTALLKMLVADGSAEKVVDKKTSFFKLAQSLFCSRGKGNETCP